MSEEKFTKGEWVVEDSRAIVCDGFKVAYACSGSNIPFISKVSANAHLIAAAPEMYELLQSIAVTEMMNGDDAFSEQINELLSKARGEL